jgi:hypothetical protein
MMDIKIIHECRLTDRTKRLHIKIPFSELVYFGFFLESFEGWCNYTTINKRENIVQIDISPDFISETEELIVFLKQWKI